MPWFRRGDCLPSTQEVSLTATITGKDMTARGLRAAAAKTADAKAARRRPVIARVPEGVDRKTAAGRCGMEQPTLWDWVHRCNAKGLGQRAGPKGWAEGPGRSAGAAVGPPPGRTHVALNPAQTVEPAQMVRKGPDPATDAVALLARRPATQDQGALRRHTARAHSGQAAGRAGILPLLAAAAASGI